MRMTKIICTLGPALDDIDVLEKLVREGMDVARFNFSHGNHEDHIVKLNNIYEAKARVGKDVALLLDTKGPEIRIGKFENNKVELQEGYGFTLYKENILGNERGVSVSHKYLGDILYKGKSVLINDGLVELLVEDVVDGNVITTVVNGGILSNNKGINIPETDTHLPSLTDQDIKDILFAINRGFDYIAVSFVRRKEDMVVVRDILKENGAENIRLIAKIENREGVDNFKEILEVSDGIMIARGDLGVEIPFEEIPSLQKYICEECNKAGKTVIVATQMLESMLNNPRPTRAEVSDVANAVYDGASAVMLSGESAAGKYPIHSVKTMVKIVKSTEDSIRAHSVWGDSSCESTVSNSIAQASVKVADNVKASAIVCVTESGDTARRISKERPNCPIIAITHSDEVVRGLMPAWGVNPILVAGCFGIEEIVSYAIEASLDLGLAKEGDVIVITSGESVSKEGTTNLLKVQKI